MLKKLLPRLRQMPKLLLAPWPNRRRKLRRRSRKVSRKRRKRVRRRKKKQRRPRPTRRPLWLARLPRMLNKRTLISQRSKPMLTRPMQRKKRLTRRLTIKLRPRLRHKKRRPRMPLKPRLKLARRPLSKRLLMPKRLPWPSKRQRLVIHPSQLPRLMPRKLRMLRPSRHRMMPKSNLLTPRQPLMNQ